VFAFSLHLQTMETNIVKIQEISEEKTEENWAFRAYLKECDMSPDEIDAIVHRLYKEISSKIDCVACANCSACPIVFNVYEALKEELWHKEPLNFDDFYAWFSEEEEEEEEE